MLSKKGKMEFNFIEEAYVENLLHLTHLNNKNINSVGFTAIHLLTKYRVNENMTTIANHRSILYFGDNFWVIDRPNEQGMVWLANTPKENWFEVGIHLYGSSQNDLGLDAQSVPRNIPQNSSRSDYPEPDKMLANNWFAIQDDKLFTQIEAKRLKSLSKEIRRE